MRRLSIIQTQRKFEKTKKALVLTPLALALAGCVTNGIYSSIDAYERVRDSVELGQDKDDVLAVLLPGQRALEPRFAKAPEQYQRDGKHVEVYFLRSQSFNDGIVTDDEFTPYVFEDGVLVAIGWTAIGGPKTQAQAREKDPDIHIHGRYGRFYYW